MSIAHTELRQSKSTTGYVGAGESSTSNEDDSGASISLLFVLWYTSPTPSVPLPLSISGASALSPKHVQKYLRFSPEPRPNFFVATPMPHRSHTFLAAFSRVRRANLTARCSHAGLPHLCSLRIRRQDCADSLRPLRRENREPDAHRPHADGYQRPPRRRRLAR